MLAKIFKWLNKIKNYVLIGLIDKEVMLENIKQKNGKNKEETIYSEEEKKIDEIYSIWDFLEFQVNTQAYYLTKVIGFEEWLTMDEVRRRISELFGVNFEHEKSLYPYIKTLVDSGLLEMTNIGGKRKWRKKDLIIKISKPREKELEKSLQTT